MNISEIKRLLESEVPLILRESPGFKEWPQDFVRRQTVSKESLDERFDRIMNELAADRENQRRHREAQEKKWEEQNRKWDESLQEMRTLNRKHDQSIGAPGARGGIASEESFRSALKGILQESFRVEVLTVNEYDDEGLVFGRPDQVELDVIIKNGTLILCELKSSVSTGDMYIFERKVRFYEKRHRRTANRRMVISPMVDARARAVAETLNIEVFSYSDSRSQRRPSAMQPVGRNEPAQAPRRAGVSGGPGPNAPSLRNAAP